MHRKGPLLLLALLSSCAGWASQRAPDDPAPLIHALGAPPPGVQVRLAAGASSRHQRQCQQALKGLGSALSIGEQPDAAITVEIGAAAPDGQRPLIITSVKKGQIRTEQRPDWWMDDLCRDALATGLRAFAAENGKKLPPTLADQAAAARKAEEAQARKEEAEERRRAARASRRDRAAPRPESSDGDKAPAKKGSQDPWGAL